MGLSKTLSYESWVESTAEQKQSLCNEIAARIAEPQFTFTGLKSHRYCEREEVLGLFEHAGKEFVLIPANEAAIGFDVNEFRPTDAQKESFTQGQEEVRDVVPVTMPEFLERFTTRSRTVKVGSMLVECVPEKPSRLPADPNLPEVQTLMRGEASRLSEFRSEFIHDDEGARKEIVVWRERSITRKEIEEEIRAQKFRLPTSDEWEYLCGGGATTLFRWGDNNPSDWRENAAYRYDRNCFFLDIAHDTYALEAVTEPDVFRGGDGGGAECSGDPIFYTWFPLATAFLCRSLANPQPEMHWSDRFQVRRVFDLE
ncbi:MAG: hypothetical protein JST89_04035 [Cyanobacteria bacterium SZAS-4]|nr:hypothetical protein [Cyanobacteria bacterium SZAS-4]